MRRKGSPGIQDSPVYPLSLMPPVPAKSRLLWITTFGLGYLKPASGTWGSMPPVAIAWILLAGGLGPTEHPIVFHAILAAILVVFSAACIVQGDAAEARFGKKDPGQCVADETAGQCLSLMFLPEAAVGEWRHATLTLLGAFVAFRLFDIIKPWPARQLQRVPGGWGILIDDLFAGIYAMAMVQIVTRTMLK